MLVPFLEKCSMAFPARCWPWSPQAVYWYQSPQAWPHLPWLEKCWPSSNPWKDQNYDNCLLQYTAVCISGIVVISKCQLDKVFFFLKQRNLFQHTCARCCSHEYISKQRASVGRLLGSLFLPYPSPVLTSTGQEFCNCKSIVVDQINTHVNILNKEKRSNSQDIFQSFSSL